MPFDAAPGIRNFYVQQQRVANGGFANLNSMSTAERRAFTGDRTWPGRNNDVKIADWAREGQSFPQPVHATLNNAAALFKGRDGTSEIAAIEAYLQDKGLGDIAVNARSEQGPSRWEHMPSGSRYPRPGSSTTYVLFTMPGSGRDYRLSVKKTDRAFVEDRGNKLRVDRDMFKQLEGHGETGQGITKKELIGVVTEHALDGKKGVLTKTERNSLLRAIDDGLFARGSTAELANKVAKGGSLSLLDIQIGNG